MPSAGPSWPTFVYTPYRDRQITLWGWCPYIAKGTSLPPPAPIRSPWLPIL